MEDTVLTSATSHDSSHSSDDDALDLGNVSLSWIQSVVDRAKNKGLDTEMVHHARSRLRAYKDLKKVRFMCELNEESAGGPPHTNLWR